MLRIVTVAAGLLAGIIAFVLMTQLRDPNTLLWMFGIILLCHIGVTIALAVFARQQGVERETAPQRGLLRFLDFALIVAVYALGRTGVDTHNVALMALSAALLAGSVVLSNRYLLTQ